MSLMNRFDKREQFRVDLNKARYDLQRIAHFVWVGWREDGAERRLGRAFEHRLALFVETCHDAGVDADVHTDMISEEPLEQVPLGGNSLVPEEYGAY